MEKQLAEEAERQWQSQAATDGARERGSKACCAPWISYAQTSSRLRLALKGHDAIDVPDEGVCSPDCAIFVCCFPFYGVLIAKLQSTVRAFYDIDGSEARDWHDGCCCPCFALVRAENEILLRESKNQQLEDDDERKDVSEASGHTYTSQAPMEPLAQLPSQTHGPRRTRSSSASSAKGKEIEMSLNSLSTIQETSREVSAAGVTGEDGPRQPLTKRSVKVHSLEDDSTAPAPDSSTTFPSVNYLDKKWFLIPASTLEENTKPEVLEVPLTEEAPVKPKKMDHGMWKFFRRNNNTGNTEVSAKHALTEDKHSSRALTTTTGHALAEDASVLKGHTEASAKHALTEDKRPPRTLTTTKGHALVDDALVLEGHNFAEHPLESDHVSPSLVPTINVSHEISDDPAFTGPESPDGGKHDLRKDPAFTVPNNSDGGKHDMREDESMVVKNMDIDATHPIEGDEPPETSPQLQSHAEREAATVSQDKGFVATFLSGIAQPLRSAQSSPAVAETRDPNETSEPPAASANSDDAEPARVLKHELADDHHR
ncbi:hypothetical protein NLU13_7913 [Sarocladium strictum]|uniref:Uncharacterized protein n=1 Tax=Sarocladium strictum TaxID=5046 RepID=A0AA39GG21_SARSR|nr:hypothetical protein NLU13_7913 [Sarocladium strictum]